MPLFRIICLNKNGLEMLIFLMVYNNINESEQVVTILYLTMKDIFGNMSGLIRVAGEEEESRCSDWNQSFKILFFPILEAHFFG